jgi:acetyl-CoA carboxylase carboxyl transferase subunit beta
VIEQTVRETLPEGFQQSEFLLEHGAIDMVISRSALRDTIGQALQTLGFGPVQEVAAKLLFAGEESLPTAEID